MHLLRCSDPNDLPAVLEFLLRVQVDARPQDDVTLRASAPGAVNARHERHEIGGYVTTWNALNPGKKLELLG